MTRGYVSLSHGLIRKPLIGLVLLALFFVATAGLGRRLPTSFLPEEDYGYFLLNIQLPPAASLDRTDAVTRKVDALLRADRGRAQLQHHRRLQPDHARDGVQQRLLLRAARRRGANARSRARTPAPSSTG